MFLLGDWMGRAIIFAKLVEAAIGRPPERCMYMCACNFSRFFNFFSSSNSLWIQDKYEFTGVQVKQRSFYLMQRPCSMHYCRSPAISATLVASPLLITAHLNMTRCHSGSSIYYSVPNKLGKWGRGAQGDVSYSRIKMATKAETCGPKYLL